ncbi:hypothetical protein LY76DRAFT_680901 [Colletotrichum caudatum]|nr:hypothetical protein LY76DRAFT_680901 [Colletotrichum caudatum]
MSYNLLLSDSPTTAGLDFTDKPYYTPRIDLVARFHEDMAQVRRWVEDNLSDFSHLNETIVLQLGSDTLPPVPNCAARPLHHRPPGALRGPERHRDAVEIDGGRGTAEARLEEVGVCHLRECHACRASAHH